MRTRKVRPTGRWLTVAMIGLATGAAGSAVAGGPLVPLARPLPAGMASGGHQVSARASAPAAAPRFADNGDGTVTDNRTGLVWLRDASCAELPRTDRSGRAFGATAVLAAGELAEPDCGLADGSRPGHWRLPDRFELESLLDLEFHDPALANAAGTAKSAPGDPFTGVETTYYWSSTTLASDPTFVWCVDLFDGAVFYAYEVNYYYVWPVREAR